MDRASSRICLEHEHGRAFREFGLVFDEIRTADPAQDLRDAEPVVSQLVISVLGDSHVPNGNQSLDPMKRFRSHTTSRLHIP